MKKIVFLTWTRADFWKIKSLIDILEKSNKFEVYVFVTWMHLLEKFWFTADEIIDTYKNVYLAKNQFWWEPAYNILANTTNIFWQYIDLIKPDLIVVHWDRLEALAWAIVGVYSNILVAHIEWWESSGSVDESVRYSISKLSHIHFVSSLEAEKKLKKMEEKNIYNIWSPDFDIINKISTKNTRIILKRYNINFDEYGIAIFHSVTTEAHKFDEYSKEFFKWIIESNKNFILIYPNNDLGSEKIIEYFEKYIPANLLKTKFKLFRSIPFEDFIVILKNAKCIVWNSSAWVRQAPFIGIPTVNVWNRQKWRNNYKSIFNVTYKSEDIKNCILKVWWKKFDSDKKFGDGFAYKKFYEILEHWNIFNIPLQK